MDKYADPEGENIEDDHETQEKEFQKNRKGRFVPAPTREEAQEAIQDLLDLLKPQHKTGRNYKKNKLQGATEQHLKDMKMFLAAYVRREEENPGKAGNWTDASNETVKFLELGIYAARKLREWSRNFINDATELPENRLGSGAKSVIDDPDLAQDIHLYLQSKGKYISPADIVECCSTEEMLNRLHRTQPIALSTARRWLLRMGYRWKKDFRGQYVDGHERKDVVSYRQDTFLLKMKEWEERMHRYLEEHGWDIPPEVVRVMIVWFHDESIFYAHDRRRNTWVHRSANPKPYVKGEDFISSHYGWLRSPSGESARVVWKPGKNRDGYFTSEDVLAQVEQAMQILATHFSGEDHAFRENDALSASKMSKGPSSNLAKNFGVYVDAQDSTTGKPIYNREGEKEKEWRPMQEQSLYFPIGHSKAVILEERGIMVTGDKFKKAQCGSSFHRDCPEGATDCCCRRILFNQPDFALVPSRLETICQAKGFPVLFLPKFHCELNFIEQCWGWAKRRYREKPASSKEADVLKNAIDCLDAVPLQTMRRQVHHQFNMFSTRSLRFMDAYRKGLTGKQAAWAAKKYRGHRTVSETILVELEKARISVE
ncbi:hypothetical protein DL96DRAFT_1743818 [Flagelloscypha sp. PMI_526]|nr:hypothetical protein DL96DRAFT_1743818 [Flagelloscypha sp. PMI_526]